MSRSAAFIALTGSLFPHTPAIAQQVPPVSPEWIESLCPTPDGTGIVLGETEERQAESALAVLATPDAPRAPFTLARGVYTPWSGRLAGISWESELEYGEHMEDWREALTFALEEGGWSWREDTRFGSGVGWSAVSHQKAVVIDGEERSMIFRFDTFDKYSVDCGEEKLLELYQREELGELEPGSPRPRNPGSPTSEAEFFARFDCDDPQVIAAFAASGSPQLAGALAEDLVTGETPYDAQENYADRLGTWLSWTMLQSGLIDEDTLLGLTDASSKHGIGSVEDDLGAMLENMDDGFAALDSGDGARTCKAYRAVMGSGISLIKEEAERAARVNSSLEDSARKLGIPID